MLSVGGSMVATTGTKITQDMATTSTRFIKHADSGVTLDSSVSIRLASSEDYSCSVWCNFTGDASSTSNKDGIILNVGGSNSTGGFTLKYNDSANDNQKINVIHWHGGLGLPTVKADTTNLVHDTWYHVGLTYTRSSKVLKIYINGALSSSHTPNPMANTSGTWNIGYKAGSLANFIAADINTAVVWGDITLSAEEMRQLHNDEKNCDATKIQSSYIKAAFLLDSKSGTGTDTVLDSGPHGAHGTANASLDTSSFNRLGVAPRTLARIGV